MDTININYAFTAFGDLIQDLLASSAYRASGVPVEMGKIGGYVFNFPLDDSRITPARCSLDAVVCLDFFPTQISRNLQDEAIKLFYRAISVHTRDGQYPLDGRVLRSAIRVAGSLGIEFEDEHEFLSKALQFSPWTKGG